MTTIEALTSVARTMMATKTDKPTIRTIVDNVQQCATLFAWEYPAEAEEAQDAAVNELVRCLIPRSTFGIE